VSTIDLKLRRSRSGRSRPKMENGSAGKTTLRIGLGLGSLKRIAGTTVRARDTHHSLLALAHDGLHLASKDDELVNVAYEIRCTIAVGYGCKVRASPTSALSGFKSVGVRQLLWLKVINHP